MTERATSGQTHAQHTSEADFDTTKNGVRILAALASLVCESERERERGRGTGDVRNGLATTPGLCVHHSTAGKNEDRDKFYYG